ncbi:MAG: helix-turn-helix domain-containing protein [Candidatus Bathyarchaeia archaeon]
MGDELSEATRVTLRDMGLTDYEIRAYLYLLRAGLSTASKISEDANIPYSKIYEVLNSLERKGWIKSQEGRPRLYYPKSPREALEETRLRIEDKISSWQKAVLLELQPIYERRGIKEKPDIWIFRSLPDATAKLKEMLSGAEKEILVAISRIMSPLIDAILPALTNIYNPNVKLQVMLSHDLMPSVNVAMVGEVRFRDEMFGGGVIIDGREVMLILGESTSSIMIWSNHLDLVKFAKDYFTYLWNSAEEKNKESPLN